MGELEKSKEEYMKIEIPKELNEMVQNTIENERKKRANEKKKSGMVWKAVGGTVAAAMAVVIVGLNTSSAMAMSAKQIPGLGPVAKVLTFRHYETKKGDTAVKTEIPGVTIQRATVKEKAFTNAINSQIQKECDAYVNGAVKRAKEYRKAFLETDGTEKEFAQKHIKINVSYEVKSHTKDSVSFVVSGTESWVSAYASTQYYNLNLNNLSYLTLQDVLGDNYIAIANKSIKAQMKTLEDMDKNVTFWDESDGGFKSINSDTDFYINEKGLPVVVFGKYEVAPGFMGNVEFVIGDEKESGKDEEQNGNEYAAFAEEIKDAFDKKDQAALADMIAYPAYIGIGEGIVVEDKADFMKIKASDIFTDKMIEMIDTYDFGTLEMCQAGVIIGDEKPNVIFKGSKDDSFGITGMNY